MQQMTRLILISLQLQKPTLINKPLWKTNEMKLTHRLWWTHAHQKTRIDEVFSEGNSREENKKKKVELEDWKIIQSIHEPGKLIQKNL